MKSVLISIQPKWCELIASGKKTVEVRKTKPKLETPFKCYIYCTQGELKDLGIIGNTMTFLTMLYTDCGYSETFAAMIFSVIGVVITFGKFVIGSATDRWGGFRAISIAFACMVLGLVFCSLLTLRNSILITLSVPFTGMGITITTVVLSYLAEDFSTEATYGRVLKCFQISHTIGLIIFGYVVGVLADVSGGYTAPFWMLTLIAAGSYAVVVAVYRKRIRESD